MADLGIVHNLKTLSGAALKRPFHRLRCCAELFVNFCRELFDQIVVCRRACLLNYRNYEWYRSVPLFVLPSQYTPVLVDFGLGLAETFFLAHQIQITFSPKVV